MIEYIEGDIFKGKEDVIVHGCNCFCNMGAGIAVQVARYYPGARAADDCQCGKKDKLGTYTKWTGQHYFYPERQVTIINAYTQFIPKASAKPFLYTAFVDVCRAILKNYYDESIAFPLIGACPVERHWKVIAKIMNEVFEDKTVRVYLYDK